MIKDKVVRVKKNNNILPKTEEEKEEFKVQSFLDMTSPSAIKFFNTYYICGNNYKSVWAIRDYPSSTSEQALLKNLGEMAGVTLRIYTSHISSYEERKIITNASNKNKFNYSTSSDLQKNIEAEENLKDVAKLLIEMHRNKEPLLNCAVYIEMSASTLEKLGTLQTTIQAELSRLKIAVDKLFLRQKEGFISVSPCGYNIFKEQFQRVLPAKSVGNLYPFNYSGKTDSKGLYIGHDKYGSNIIVDFDKRSNDKLNSNIAVLGTSGQGKSYTLKLLILNMIVSGKSGIILDPENEFFDLVKSLGGEHIDMMSGENIINVLEPKNFMLKEEGGGKKLKVSTHISFLRDFFTSYKSFSDKEIDTIEIMLNKLYDKFDITNNTDFSILKSTDYPTLSDLYNLIEDEFKNFNEYGKVYTKELLQKILLSLHSICIGSESQFFNGYTNIKSDRLVCFGVKQMLNASKSVKNALIFNIISYMSDALLSKGNTFAVIDELHLFLSNLKMVEYLNQFMKRVRKKDSSIVLATQNIEDVLRESIKEYTKPLFAIPTYHFIFHCGLVDKRLFKELLHLEDNEYELIQNPSKGECLFKSGAETFHIKVNAPVYKFELFGDGGGK